MAGTQRMKRYFPLLLLLIAIAFSSNAAHAQTYKCTSPESKCTRAEAYADCQKSLDDSRIPGNYQFLCEEKPSRYIAWQGYNNSNWTPITQHLWVVECPDGSSWNDSTHLCTCPSGQLYNSYTKQCQTLCSTRPVFQTGSYASTGQYIPNGSVGCRDGCAYVQHNNGDGTATGSFLGDDDYNLCAVLPSCDTAHGWYVSTGSGMCQPPVVECKANQAKDPKTGECKDTCPVGKVLQADGQCANEKNTCPAGQVKAPDGSCVQDSCPSGQTKGSDGTCKKSDDPNKDEGDDDKYFSGGDSCDVPPQCSGDQILCGQARIQWRIDCNTRRNTNIAGGACAAMPVCTGDKCDALEYAQLLQQWRTTCALEKMADGVKTDPGQPDWTKVGGMNQDAGSGQTADDVRGVQTVTDSLNDLDSGGWLGGLGSCPAIVVGGGGDGFGAAFSNALASPPAYFCNFIGMMAAIVMLGAAVVSAFILAKG